MSREPLIGKPIRAAFSISCTHFRVSHIDNSIVDFELWWTRNRRQLHVHCYRMLGSFDDAEDAVQETCLRAWRKLSTFEARATIRAWLYRIATRVCLDAIEKETIELVFLVAIQQLPPRQRAVLILRDVVGWQARTPRGHST